MVVPLPPAGMPARPAYQLDLPQNYTTVDPATGRMPLPVPLISAPPNFRDERWLHDNAPLRGPQPIPPSMPPNVAGLSPLQVGAAGLQQPYTAAALAELLSRIYGQG